MEMIVVKKSKCVWSVRAAFTWLLLAHLAGCGRGSGPTNRLSLTTTVNDKVVGVTDLVFDNDTATTTTDGKVERFDLRDERWFDESRNKWITLAESRKWTENSIAQSRKTLEATPSTDTKPLMEWMISPRFDVTQEGDVLLLNSEFIHYRIKTAPGGPQLKNLLKYSRLNAYRKAMTLRQGLPLPELLVLKELENRNLLPLRIEFAYTSPTDTSTAIIEMTPFDVDQ